MRKNVSSWKGIVTVAVMLGVFWTGSGIVCAQTVGEVESNDKMSTAQVIQANKEDPVEAADGDRPDQYVVSGYTDLIDEDWFKVYLTSGVQYVTCNNDAFDFEVYNPNEKLIMEGSYTKVGFGSKAYSFNAASSGYYYVKVRGLLSKPTNYILSVGGPTYAAANCEVKLGNITMAGGNDTAAYFSLSYIPQLPENAIVYSVSARNVLSSNVDSITVDNVNSGKSVSLRTYSWDRPGIASQHLPLKSGWQVNFGYKKNVSFSPSVKFYYVYPVVSEYYDDIVLTR